MSASLFLPDAAPLGEPLRTPECKTEAPGQKARVVRSYAFPKARFYLEQKDT
jgi:hypothetical protein